MNSPRSGLRRAAAASWALAGIGVAGVAGASALAYADTLKPAAEAAAVAVDPAETQPPVTAVLPAAPVEAPAATSSAVETAVQAPAAPAPAPVATRTYVPAPTQAYTPPPAPVYTAPAAPVYIAPPAPVYIAPPAPVYTAPAAPAYTPPPAAVAAPAPAQSSSGGFPIRRSHTPLGGGGSSSGGNKFSPSHTASRGS